MDKRASTSVGSIVDDAPALHDSRPVDAIIIGAGLGGLLSAAQLLQRGKRVVVVERLPHSGGRFTAKTFQGVQVSTGAVHMVPFGSSGVLASMLRRLHVPHRLFDADVFGSFHVHGKQYRSRGLLGVFQFLGPVQSFWFTRIGYLMFLRPLPAHERDLPFDLWLERHVNVRRNPQLVAFFERIARFALSLELGQVSTAEVVRITKNMLRYGAPGIVQGGCGELTKQLQQHLLAQGGDLLLAHEVLQILSAGGQVTGVRVRNKQRDEEILINAPLVVSDIGPRATTALLDNRRVTQAEVLKKKNTAEEATEQMEGLHPSGENVGNAGRGVSWRPPWWPQREQRGRTRGDAPTRVPPNGPSVQAEPELQEAIGLKVHILSDVSLIPHKGIMYCLDTKRIAGMVQPTNSDPSLAPPGKHLLISHQVIQSNDVAEERALALADLHMLFGADFFAEHCRVLTMGTYRGEWPVNRIAQGEDVRAQTATQGLYLVGDAVKPSGYLMVEGVAQSVNRFLDLFEASDQQQVPASRKAHAHHEMSPPSRLNALLWLWKAPGNSGK